MPLSRLENFLKNAEGNILYVNPSDFDATDSFENQGNSLARPFKTIQRALIEAARFSYQSGRNNDKIDKTTILVYPGTHYIDNRPGFSIEESGGLAVYRKRTGVSTWSVDDIDPFGPNTNYNILSSTNDLYKFNSVSGGAILPRGTSIIGLDLRKTKIRPLYVPNPNDPDIEDSSIFNVTGTCYFTAFTIFDADLTKTVFKDYGNDRVVPNYSHHKLTTFTYADGVNNVILADRQIELTDLQMYYYKVAKAYGDITNRGLGDYPNVVDFEPSIDEFRIVGNLQANSLGISSIRSGNGDGTGDLSSITVSTVDLRTGDPAPHNLFENSPVIISGVEVDTLTYNGSYAVSEIVGLNTFRFTTSTIPSNYLPSPTLIDTATVSIESDTVSSASPYIFNVSLRSVYGLCGMHADGNKATGFKSMVVAQYTGVSLQKDDNAFLVYKNGSFEDNASLPTGSEEKPLHTFSGSIYKPSFENYHIKCSNDSFVQCVSVFAIGFAKHFITETGGDMSITNSNSNFGATSLESSGFKKESFNKDDVGYITHIIPPKESTNKENDITWLSLDAEKINSSPNPEKLYIYRYNDIDTPPPHQLEGYRVGAKINDLLYLSTRIGTATSTFTAPILMPGITVGSSSNKTYEVDRTGSINSIASDVITLTQNHEFLNGEKVRVFSDSGQVPDGLVGDTIYYVITNGSLNQDEIQLSLSLNDAISGIPITGLGNNGGRLNIVSTVSDKLPNDVAHPIQYDDAESQWYINSSPTNDISDKISDIGFVNFSGGPETPSTQIKRKLDNRGIDDRIYKIRYVIPKEYLNARPPQAGFILQESKSVGVSTASYNTSNLVSPAQLRNEKVISGITASAVVDGYQIVTATTELPHKFSVGNKVKVQRVRSTNNPLGTGSTSTFNGTFEVINVLDSRTFTYKIDGVLIQPGTFTNDLDNRSTRQGLESLPLVSREQYTETYFIYRANTIKELIPGEEGQDGVYQLIVLSSNVSPPDSVGYDLDKKKFNQDVRNLYPQIDRDNFNSDPSATSSFPELQTIGKVLTNDKKKSLTKEALNDFIKDSHIGFTVTNISLSGVGNTTLTLTTDVEHGLNSIKNFSTPGALIGSSYDSNKTYYSNNLIDPLTFDEESTCYFETNVTGQVISSSIKLLNPGSAYSIGDVLTVKGGASDATITVTEINDNVGDGLQLSGFNQVELNDTFKITDIPSKNEIEIYVPDGIASYVPNTNGYEPIATIASDGISISNISLLDITTGIATVTTSSAHGILSGNTVKIQSNSQSIFNGEFVVLQNIDLTSFTFDIGYRLNAPATGTGGIVLKSGISANAKNLGRGEENLGSRASYLYSGLSNTISSQITFTDTTITLSSANGFKRGDYVIIDSELIRLASNSNPFTVLRGQFGTRKTTHISGSVVKKVNVLPMEVRRPSFMRASGHTFEYLGYGPGNYSTGMPQKQSKVLSEDEILVSQAKEQYGGTVVYTGLNDLGEFYSGSKKLISATGEEKVIEAPIITYTGDDAQGEDTNLLSGIFDEILIKKRLTVEGGENNNQTSQFYGPVSFTRKLTNLSDEGIEAKNLFLKGELAVQSKLITVGISTPTAVEVPSPRFGDISLISEPTTFVGYSYNDKGGVRDWRPFGIISQDKDLFDLRIDKLGIGVDSGAFKLNVSGNTQLENLSVTGSINLPTNITLGDVGFENITVSKTATFTGLGFTPGDPPYTQIHDTGWSKLYNLEVVGVSTFRQRVDFEKDIYGTGAKFGNIQVGITTDNQIDTTSGALILDSNAGITSIKDNVKITGNEFRITTAVGSARTTLITNSRILDLGIGNQSNIVQLNLHDQDGTYPDFGLSIQRKSGIGTIRHRGTQPFNIIASEAADLKFYTSNIERFRISKTGIVTSYQNSVGGELKGALLKLTQAGVGDVVFNWDITYNNIGQRWYAGIDTSDSYSWKLAHPQTTTAYGNESFANETKLKVDTAGNTTIGGSLALGGLSLSTGASGAFNLLTSNITSLNLATNTSSISIGSNSVTSFVNVRGTTPSTSTGTGALVVGGGVGIAGALNAGGNTSLGGTLTVQSGITLNTGTATLPSVNIDGGNIDDTVIGAVTRAAGNFTSVNANAASSFGGAVVSNLVLSKYGEVVSNLNNVTGTKSIDLNNGNVFIGTLTGNTTFTFDNPLTGTNVGSSFTLILRNNVGLSTTTTISWPTTVRFPGGNPPNRTLDSGRADIYIFITPDQGTTWYGNIALYNFP